MALLKTAAADLQAGDRSGIEQVMQRAPAWRGACAELAVFDLEHGIGNVARQNAHFVVVEGTADDLQMPASRNECRRRCRPRHARREIRCSRSASRALRTTHSALPSALVTIGDEDRPLADGRESSAAPAVQTTACCRYSPGQDLDRVAVTRQSRGFADASNRFLRTDDEGPAATPPHSAISSPALAGAGSLVGDRGGQPVPACRQAA
jgi:hypothetical protein